VKLFSDKSGPQDVVKDTNDIYKFSNYFSIKNLWKL
jgi:hypothetical protein